MRIPGILLFPLLLVSCTALPPVRSFFAGDGVVQHFISPTNWNARGSSALLDITYRTRTDDPAIINISFFGNRSTPQNVSSVSLHGTGVDYHLENISVILVRPAENELRITSTGDRDGLLHLLNSENITLRAEIDGVIFIHTPGRNFDRSRTYFLAALF